MSISAQIMPRSVYRGLCSALEDIEHQLLEAPDFSHRAKKAGSSELKVILQGPRIARLSPVNNIGVSRQDENRAQLAFSDVEAGAPATLRRQLKIRRHALFILGRLDDGCAFQEITQVP